ncbi:MAG: glycosyltransferase, partial [Christensenellales bacterium]
MKKIIFTGGGTGGHIMPNIALIENLKSKYDCKYIGSPNSMEQKLITPLVPFFSITTCKLKRSFSLSNLLIPFKLIKGIFQAKKILKAEKPDLVFSKGGYVAVPVVISAHMLKIPIVAHESDMSVGLANKLTQKYATTVCTSFEKTSKSIKNG